MRVPMYLLYTTCAPTCLMRVGVAACPGRALTRSNISFHTEDGDVAVSQRRKAEAAAWEMRLKLHKTAVNAVSWTYQGCYR